MSNLNKILIGVSVLIAVILAALSVIIYTRGKTPQQPSVVQLPQTTSVPSRTVTVTKYTQNATGTTSQPGTTVRVSGVPESLPRQSSISIDDKGIWAPFKTLPPGIPVVIKNFSTSQKTVTIRTVDGNKSVTLQPNETYLFSATKGDVTMEVASGTAKKITFIIDDTDLVK